MTPGENKKSRKGVKNVKKRILALAGVLALMAVLVVPTTALASNVGTQGATTDKASTITIVGQDYSTPVSAITFPAGAPGAVISTPTNDQTEIQVFGAAGTAKPVVALLNGSSGALKIWYTITTFSPDLTDSTEKYLISTKGAVCADADAVNLPVVFTTLTESASTITNGAGNEMDLYLVLTLGAAAGGTGSSTITIFGETP